MTGNDAVLGMVDALTDLKIPYMMVGSYVSGAWGVPRSTQDADFVIIIDADGIAKLRDRLGAAFQIDPQMSFETATFSHRYVVNTAAKGFKIELFLPLDDPYDRERFSRRQAMPILGRSVYAATAEDMIVNKLKWHRRKDVDDVRNVIATNMKTLDWPYIHHWCDLHGTRQLLDEIRASIPDIPD